MRIRFAPTTTGAAGATLTLNDNAPGSPHRVAITGTGTGT